MELSTFGITRLEDGRIRSNGGEVHFPITLLWFKVPTPRRGQVREGWIHLPGSESGDPEFWTESEFIQYCRDMADDGTDDGTEAQFELENAGTPIPVVLNVSAYSPSELGSLVIQASMGYGCTCTLYSEHVTVHSLYLKIEGEHSAQFAND